MKNLIRIGLVIILIFLLSFTLQAQEPFAKLEKNRNVQAKSLIHELNTTKDTLILKSENIITSLYTINQEYARELDFKIDSIAYKLPLNKLSKGKHVFVARQSQIKIVFVVKILRDASKADPDDLLTSNLVGIEETPVKITSRND
ncbi:hypothetical protein [Winogradskyella thalassocola]|uniref:Uncharacterized protein n=1 Tax=Winogradskyella thalassocola TaxID=262004 RepID=A0A1G8GYP6_9FLAO|nr:hypothetical protein [Winogradskyella thalassocola]SDH99487.1 hypothetical protein SAMN04489796_10669 [Winogradskyella thalassocola]